MAGTEVVRVDKWTQSVGPAQTSLQTRIWLLVTSSKILLHFEFRQSHRANRCFSPKTSAQQRLFTLLWKQSCYGDADSLQENCEFAQCAVCSTTTRTQQAWTCRRLRLGQTGYVCWLVLKMTWFSMENTSQTGDFTILVNLELVWLCELIWHVLHSYIKKNIITSESCKT